MKIGIVLSKPPGYSETFFISKIKGLQEGGYKVVLFVQKNDPSYVMCEVCTAPQLFKKNKLAQIVVGSVVIFKLLLKPNRVIRFFKLERLAKRSFLQCIKNIINNSHILSRDVAWLHFGFATMALQSEHVAKAIGAKMAVSLRGFDMDVYPLKHPNCYDLLWKQVDKVHTISQYLLKKAYASGLSVQKPYQIITPAIDINKFKKKSSENVKNLQLLTVARLHWIKGINYTLEALSLLKNKGLEFKYTLIGSGPEYEPIVYAVHQLGLTGMVNLVGATEHDAIFEYLSKTEIYIQYSDSEGFCNAVLEAQAMGCLCIVSEGGALKENVIHDQTGWVVPKRNPEKLAQAIMNVIQLPEENRQSISENARNRVIHNFNLEKQQEEFFKFYEETIS